jgi:hypothetical protein
MNDLRDIAIAAHGGMDRWDELSTVTVRMRAGGVLWALKGQDGVINDSTVRVDLHRQLVRHAPFGAPDLHDRYTPGKVTIENAHDEVLEQRFDPRSAFTGHTLETRWDRLHLAYFTGYAMWTYLTQPLSWLRPGVEVEELDRWHENNETWRRLRVRFPADVATHSAENLYYLDDRGLIRRHDYTTEVLGSTTPAAHYAFDHQVFEGIHVPTRRRVHLIGLDGAVMPEPVVVTIDLDDVRFE